MENFLNDSAQTFASTKTVEFLTVPGFCYHQVDVGLATAGTIAVYVNFGTGYKLVETVDFTDNTASVLVAGHIKSIKLVPTSVSAGGYNVSYSAGSM
ncbi:MAG: hypothetical protein EOM03_12040 [Clostridia bacterium]|nr:hypothetical protein [Clostridia bacterium]